MAWHGLAGQIMAGKARRGRARLGEARQIMAGMSCLFGCVGPIKTDNINLWSLENG